jgi:hypothetical protein
MKKTMAMTLAMVGWGTGSLVAGETTREAIRVYFQCEGSVNIVGPVFAMAQKRASGLLADAGVTLEWRNGRPPEEEIGYQTLMIRFVPSAPADYRHGQLANALASALPYGSSSEISVFNDRVTGYLQSYSQTDRGKLLGHILAHEIVHILEGVARHSKTGLMTANWTWREMRVATTHGLRMAEEDKRLVSRGVEARRRRSTAIAVVR